MLNFKQMKEMLGNIGSTLAYKLLRKNINQLKLVKPIKYQKTI